MPGNHFPLEGESQKPSRMAKADAVVGVRRGHQVARGRKRCMGCSPPGNAGVPPAPYLAKLGQSLRRHPPRNATVAGSMCKGRMRFVPGNHFPLAGESQPSRMAKADAVGGVRCGVRRFKGEACHEMMPPRERGRPARTLFGKAWPIPRRHPPRNATVPDPLCKGCMRSVPPDDSRGVLYSGRNQKSLLPGLAISMRTRSGDSCDAIISEVVEWSADSLLVRTRRLDFRAFC